MHLPTEIAQQTTQTAIMATIQIVGMIQSIIIVKNITFLRV